MLSFGCLSTNRKATTIEVKFIPQEVPNHCGAIAIAMALDYYQLDYDITNITRQVFIPILNGSSFETMAEAVTHYGLTATRAELSPAAMRPLLAQHKLCIIYLAPTSKSPIGHFAMVTGISRNLKKIRIHGTQSANLWLPLKRLQPRSDHGRFPTLIIAPSDLRLPQHVLQNMRPSEPPRLFRLASNQPIVQNASLIL